MRQSLANAAARGTSAASIAEQKRELLAQGDIEGLLALNRSVYGSALMVADDEADDDPDDDDATGDADDEDDDEDSDDDAEGSKKPDPRARRIQELAAESKKHRLKARDYRRERDEALAELEKLKGKGKAKDGDAEDDGRDDDTSAQLKAENEELKTRLMAQQLRSEFNDLTSGSNAIAQFKNPKTAFRLLDLDDVEVNEDGEIEGLDDAIKALAKSDPYLLDTGKDDEDDDEDDEVSARRRRKTGQPTRKSSGKANPNRDKLVSKYPALRR